MTLSNLLKTKLYINYDDLICLRKPRFFKKYIIIFYYNSVWFFFCFFVLVTKLLSRYSGDSERIIEMVQGYYIMLKLITKVHKKCFMRKMFVLEFCYYFLNIVKQKWNGHLRYLKVSFLDIILCDRNNIIWTHLLHAYVFVRKWQNSKNINNRLLNS